MTLESLRTYCLAKKGVTESLPFDENTLVFKVMDKMFALTDFVSQPMSFNVKCDPERAVELREQYPCVQPGYHMNKKHWNTVVADGSVPDRQLQQWIDDSYDLVVKSLSRTQREELEKSG
jgi:predicted DNA-binding protein (MmcQ/YjbR family)